MKPFVEEYFKRDLTSAEEEEFARQLEGSPEEAEKFAAAMGDLYKANGLPTPVWTERPAPWDDQRGPSWRALIPGSLILLLLGFLGYQMLRPNAPSAPAATAPAPTAVAAQPTEPLVKKQPPAKASPAPTALPKVNPPTVAPNLPLPLLPVPPTATTIPLASPPIGQQYEELSVVVEPTSPSLATVKVLDGQNNEIRTLFAGILAAGKRTFTWDGNKDDGTLAAAGTYFIEVRSGQNVMRRQVKVQSGGN